MTNLKNIMKQAQQMQEKLAEVQEKMAELHVEGNAGGGMVIVTVNGKGELQKVKLDPSLLDPSDVEMLEDLIVAAFNDAKSKAEAAMQEEMSNLTGGIPLPGGMKLPF